MLANPAWVRGRHASRARALVEPHRAAKEVIGVKAPEDEIGIGDGGSIASTVTGGSGIGAGGLWPDLQGSRGIDPGQRPAARAGGVNVEHGDADGQSAYLAFDGGRRLARGIEQRNVSRCAAHVEAEQAFDAGARATLSAPTTPPAGPDRIVRRVDVLPRKPRGFHQKIA